MRFDPYNLKERYEKWKEENSQGMKEVSLENSILILNYINDMERGINIAASTVKGARSHIRLLSVKERMVFFCKKIEEKYKLTKITEINEDQLMELFSDIRSGKIRKKNGAIYKSIETITKEFKAFWHWWQRVNKKKGIEIQDITVYLDTRGEKPDWVYLTENEVRKLCENAKPYYRLMMMFLFDTGIRAPTELMNVKVSDFFNDFKELNIRQETSKTFGRRIKLMICPQILKEYISSNKLKPEEFIFTQNPFVVNKYLKRLAVRILGDKLTEAGGKTSQLSMYDFRHISCCYWLPIYKSESALKYRFGWKKSEKIHYYSELLGMKDTISQEDMLVDITKTEIERKLIQSDKEKEILSEKMESLQNELFDLKKAVAHLLREIPIQEKAI
jgi:integrase